MMIKLEEIGSCFFILISIFLCPPDTEQEHKIYMFLIFISSIFYHGYQYKSNDLFLGYNIYKNDKKYIIYKYLDKLCILNIYLYNCKILDNYSFLTRTIICGLCCFREDIFLLFLCSCGFLFIPIFTLMRTKELVFFFVTLSIKGILYKITKNKDILPIKYIWHFVGSLSMISASYINIAYNRNKTNVYYATKNIVLIVYCIFVYNYVIYNYIKKNNKIKDK
jgi:hypothetical protein